MTTRRRFLQGITGAGAMLWLRPELARAAVSPSPLPDPAAAPFDHVVVLMFENRSFDHLLGWLPGADGVQAGLRFADQTGTVYPTYDLGADTQGCDYLDPDHSWEGFVTQHAGGRLDGWLQTPADRGTADTFPIGFYTADAIPGARRPGGELHRARPLLLVVHGRDVPQSLLPARRRGRTATTTWASP